MAQPTEEEIKNMSPEQIAEMQKQNCIFCKIVAGEIPSKKIYEDNDFIGILDINPAAQGHVLIIPKKHFQILPQIPQDLVGKLGIAAKNVSDKVLKAFQSDGTSIFIANGMVAGQKAPHFILHVIPRTENDNVPLNPQIIEINASEFSDTVKKIKLGLGVPIAPHSEEKPEEKSEPIELKKESKTKDEPIEDKDDSGEDEFEDDTSEEQEEDNNEDSEEDEPKEDTNSKNNDKDDSDEEEVDLDKIAKLFV